MSSFFLMSKRFNKTTPEDFGLVRVDGATAKGALDGSVWRSCRLYDLGWGEEVGFYREPLPDYPQLLRIVLESQDEEDRYGAAAIIIRQYPEMLLETCEQMLLGAQRETVVTRLAPLFRLHTGMNLCPVVGKTVSQISSDAYRWHKIAETVDASRKRSIFPFRKRK